MTFKDVNQVNVNFVNLKRYRINIKDYTIHYKDKEKKIKD